MDLVQTIAELAMEAENTDTIDWGMLAIKEKDAYMMMSNSALDIIANVPDDDVFLVLISTVTKLMVENFVLNARLMGAEV
jgi:hypothetical protein